MLKQILLSRWPSLAWTLLIFILLSVNTGSMESMPFLGIKHLDKLVHVLLFAILGFLWVYYLSGKGMNMWLPVLIITALYGMGMEFYQEYFTSREFEWNDFYADLAGSAMGSWAGKKIGPYGNRGRNQN